jgi:hypothetical protein
MGSSYLALCHNTPRVATYRGIKVHRRYCNKRVGDMISDLVTDNSCRGWLHRLSLISDLQSALDIEPIRTTHGYTRVKLPFIPRCGQTTLKWGYRIMLSFTPLIPAWYLYIDYNILHS